MGQHFSDYKSTEFNAYLYICIVYRLPYGLWLRLEIYYYYYYINTIVRVKPTIQSEMFFSSNILT